MIRDAERASSPSDPGPSPIRLVDVSVAVLAAAAVFGVYVRTMYPGIFPVGDATKFAFVGKVLGTPHAPGYPLYVMVSHLFSYIPWGTLAHRMNGMSAVFGAIAVGLAYAIGRMLGFGPLASVSAAVSFGLGRSFWSRALYAKTYTLNAAIVALGLLLLLRWGRTRKRSHLYAAIAMFALSIGNHLIVVSLVPALTIYAVLIDRREALAWRTIAFTVAAVAIGLCQYLFIIVRTLQRAPYLEARATNLRELVEVVTARRWSQEIGAYSANALVRLRVPIMAGLVVHELTVGGLALAVVGLIVLLRKRWREAVLCSAGAAGVLILTANMSSNEDEGFLLPAFLMLWLIAGAGLDAIVRAISSRRQHRGTFGAPAAAAVLACASAMPIVLVAENYSANDHHDRTYETRYFDALFDMLPGRAAIIKDRYTIDMMLQYKLLGENAARGRTIDIILPDHAILDARLAQGFQVFAFDQGRQPLEDLGYGFAPVTLTERNVSASLAAVRPGWVVAFASTPSAAPVLRPDRQGWKQIGADGDALFGGGHSLAVAIVGVSGKRNAARDANPFSASLSIGRGSTIGGADVTAPAAIQATADTVAARVVINGRELARSERGAVLAVINPTGRAMAYVLDPRDAFRIPLDMRPMPLYRLSEASTCRDIGNQGWTDLSAIAADGNLAIRINDYRPFLSTAVFYVAGPEAARPELTRVTGVGSPAVTAESFQTSSASGREALQRAVDADHAHLPATFSSVQTVSRVEFTVNDKGAEAAARLGFGITPAAVFGRATVDLDNPRRATVCGRGVISRRGTAP